MYKFDTCRLRSTGHYFYNRPGHVPHFTLSLDVAVHVVGYGQPNCPLSLYSLAWTSRSVSLYPFAAPTSDILNSPPLAQAYDIFPAVDQILDGQFYHSSYPPSLYLLHCRRINKESTSMLLQQPLCPSGFIYVFLCFFWSSQ